MKKTVLVDVKIECDPPRSYWHRTPEQLAKYLQGWVDDFHEFMRDHRSQDPVSLHIEKIYQDQCSFCGSEWELDENDIPVCCEKAIVETENLLNPPVDAGVILEG